MNLQLILNQIQIEIDTRTKAKNDQITENKFKLRLESVTKWVRICKNRVRTVKNVLEKREIKHCVIEKCLKSDQGVKTDKKLDRESWEMVFSQIYLFLKIFKLRSV